MGADPIEKAYIQNTAQPLANTDILADDITPTNVPCIFRIQVIMSNAGNFSVTIDNGVDTQIGTLNILSGPALVADGLYVFDVLVHLDDSINFIYSATGGTINILRVQEIY